jgi:hypothetical protein
MMPAYVRIWFSQVMPLIGIRITGSLDAIFSFDEAPETVFRALGNYPQELQNRLTFDRSQAMPKTALGPEAIYLHPGEPVFEAVMDIFLGRHENEVARRHFLRCECDRSLCLRSGENCCGASHSRFRWNDD